MLLTFLDTETTGLNPEKHRIVEIAFKVVDTNLKKSIFSHESIVAQTAEVWAEADPESLLINGFTWEQMLQGKTEKSVASEIIQGLNHLQIGRENSLFICQNPSFDRTFFNQLISPDLQMEFDWPYRWLDLASMYWTKRILQDHVPLAELNQTSLSKNEIAKHFGFAPEPFPHRAMRGVDHLIMCYEALFGSS